MKLLLAVAAQVAFLVNEPSVDPGALTAALKSADDVERATAARVAAVRAIDGVVPQLRDALASETVAETAREEMRALVLLGSDDDVAFAASHLAKFPSSIDGDFAETLGRLGAPRAIDLYLRHASRLRNTLPPVGLALWGRSNQATLTASRILGASDRYGFQRVLDASKESSVPLEAGILAAALRSKSSEIVTDTLWYLIEMYAENPAALPETVRAPAAVSREGAAIDETFARAVIGRMFGAKPETRKEWLAWLRTPEGRMHVPAKKQVLGFLTMEEQRALEDERLAKLKKAPAGTTFAVRAPSFAIPIMLPRGLPEQIFEETGCRDGWLGVAGATVDRLGRVQSVDLAKVKPSRACTRALETMLRLSFADPSSFLAPFAANFLVVKAPGDASCLDEPPVDESASPAETLRPGADIKVPKVLRRVEPEFPASVRRAMKPNTPLIVVVEVLITKSGCVRDIHLLSQTQWPELNGAAATAVSRWKFEPGTMDGRPVDVVFNLTVSFRRGL